MIGGNFDDIDTVFWFFLFSLCFIFVLNFDVFCDLDDFCVFLCEILVWEIVLIVNVLFCLFVWLYLIKLCNGGVFRVWVVIEIMLIELLELLWDKYFVIFWFKLFGKSCICLLFREMVFFVLDIEWFGLVMILLYLLFVEWFGESLVLFLIFKFMLLIMILFFMRLFNK